MIKKHFALLAICLFFIAIITSACGGGGKTTPPDNSALYYLLAQQNANNNQEQQNNQQQENNNQQQENNEQENGVIEVTLDDDVLQKLGYQKEEKTKTIEGYEVTYYTLYNLKKGEEEITSIEIPSTFTYENKTYKITKIGNTAFFHCLSLNHITIPEGVTEIEDGDAYEIDENTTPYGSFAGVGGLAPEGITIELPSSLTKIGKNAFYASTITTIEIPESVTTIGGYAFSSSTIRTVEIPSSVTTIEGGVFANCRNLTSVTIPNSVTTIGEYAFYYTSLENVTIPSSVTTIGEDAFYRVDNINISEEQKSLPNYPWGANKVNGISVSL